MPKFKSRPREVDAHQHKRGEALPEPFASFQGIGAYGAPGGIVKGAVGELLIPQGGLYDKADEGDWLVMTVEGGVSVLSDATFNKVYEPIDAPDAPGTSSGSAAEAEASTGDAESEG